MVSVSRLAHVIGPIVLGGCVSTATAISETHRLVSAEPIRTEFVVTTRLSAQSADTVQITLSPATAAGHEKEYLGYVLIDSGQKCQAFADRLSVAQRGVDTSFDILTVILSALATAITPLSTVHGLTAAATISTGTKTAIDADIYAKATAALILQEIKNTYYVHIDDYRKELIDRDTAAVIPSLEVSSIDAIHRQCSLDYAIASLSQSGAAAAATIGAISGAAAGASAAQRHGLSEAAGAIAGAAAGAGAGAAAGGAAGAPQMAASAGATAGAIAGAKPGAAVGGTPGVPVVIVPPPAEPPIINREVATGAIPAPIAKRRSALIAAIRDLGRKALQDAAAKDRLDTVAEALQVEKSSNIRREVSSIISAIEAFVSSPQQARLQMDDLSRKLNDILMPTNPF
jgi:hypothetical protein